MLLPLLLNNLLQPVAPPAPGTAGGGQIRRHRKPGFTLPETAPPVIVRGSLYVIEAADGFFATGDAHESAAQLTARRRRRRARIILLSS